MSASAPPPPTYNAAVGMPGPGYPGQPGGTGFPAQPGGYSAQPGYPPQGGQGAPGQGPPPMPMPFRPPPNTMPAPGYGGAQPHMPSGYQPPPQPVGGQPVDPEAGQPKPWSDEDDFTRGDWSDKAIRRAFIRKVYLILTAQLLVTVGVICFFLFHLPTKIWVRQNSWFYYVSYATFFVTYIVLVCCPKVRRKYPGNFICLAVFTLAFSYMVGTISSYYNHESVMIAVGITAAVCLAISIFAIQTKIDFTLCSGLLFALVMVLFFFGIACMIVMFTIGYNHILNCVYAGLGALVFSLFLVFDTQQIVGGRKHELSQEEYIYGALQLYLDVVYIFIFLLSFFKSS
ncbi:unnamed protein product [Owenia fusiformis]|uniref:Uncharacterized protein n=1 Tax=Owenia fusiformis TaxID=6347 RepID=A0A8J1U7X0_OWEFU|nr:unnamed protein product [Owenia fusiformis]